MQQSIYRAIVSAGEASNKGWRHAPKGGVAGVEDVAKVSAAEVLDVVHAQVSVARHLHLGELELSSELTTPRRGDSE